MKEQKIWEKKSKLKNQIEVLVMMKYIRLNKYLAGCDQEENGDDGE